VRRGSSPAHGGGDDQSYPLDGGISARCCSCTIRSPLPGHGSAQIIPVMRSRGLPSLRPVCRIRGRAGLWSPGAANWPCAERALCTYLILRLSFSIGEDSTLRRRLNRLEAVSASRPAFGTCSHHVRKSGTASADPSCRRSEYDTVSEMSAAEKALLRVPPDASERAFCARQLSGDRREPFAYTCDGVLGDSAVRSSEDAALTGEVGGDLA